MKEEQRSERQPTVEERDKFTAEAEAARALARKTIAEAEEAEHSAAVACIEREKAEEKRAREKHADAYPDRSYQFGEVVGDASVKKCMMQLAQWHRESPDCEMEIVFDSPGGSVVDGMHLFDYISGMREQHKITTRTRGMAASMAGILLQAGDVRVMGPQASLMIHEASFAASGKIGDVEDTTEWVNKVQERILSIFADRVAGSDDKKATKKLTKTQLRNRWRRKNWWLDSDEALRHGLVDEVH